MELDLLLCHHDFILDCLLLLFFHRLVMFADTFELLQDSLKPFLSHFELHGCVVTHCGQLPLHVQGENLADLRLERLNLSSKSFTLVRNI